MICVFVVRRKDVFRTGHCSPLFLLVRPLCAPAASTISLNSIHARPVLLPQSGLQSVVAPSLLVVIVPSWLVLVVPPSLLVVTPSSLLAVATSSPCLILTHAISLARVPSLT
jgi:hypothetical protein